MQSHESGQFVEDTATVADKKQHAVLVFIDLCKCGERRAIRRLHNPTKGVSSKE